MAILHLCRSDSEACLGAVQTPRPGLVVSLFAADGVPCARTATVTLFGPVVRRHDDVEPAVVDSMVLDTLAGGESDVWLVGATPRDAERYADAAERRGHTVDRRRGDEPAALVDPFGVFAARRLRPGAGPDSPTLSFCKIDPAATGPLGIGALLTMQADDAPDGGCDVVYVALDGRRVGLHGHLPYRLPPESLARLAAVDAVVSYTSWGREWHGGVLRDYQIVMFDIPADVDALLADARLPRAEAAPAETTAEETVAQETGPAA